MTIAFQPDLATPELNGSDADPGQPESPSAQSDDPYSPGLIQLLQALGGLIGVIAIVLPLATVLAARPPSPEPPSVHGSEPAAGIPSARAREPGGGDSRWLAQ